MMNRIKELVMSSMQEVMPSMVKHHIGYPGEMSAELLHQHQQFAITSLMLSVITYLILFSHWSM